MIRNTFLLLSFASILLIGCKGDQAADMAPTGDPAIDNLTQQITRNRQNHELYYERAKLLYQQDDYEQTISDLQQALSIDSLQPQYYHLLSDAYLDNAESRAALKAMDTASRLFSDRLPTLLKLTELQFILKQYEKALGTINHIFYLEKEDPQTFLMLGLVLYETGQLDRAKNVLTEAVDRDPDLDEAWSVLGRIAEQQEDSLAKTYYENAARVAVDQSAALHNLAYYLQNNGDLPGAIDVYRRIIIRDPRYKPAFMNLGVLYSEQDSLDKSLEHFTAATKLEPTDATAHYYRALVLDALNRPQQAIEAVQTALRLESDYEEALDLLEQLQG